MNTLNIIEQAHILRSRICRARFTTAQAVCAHKQIALRRIRDAILLAGRNPSEALSRLRDAEFHAQFVTAA